MVKGVFYSWDKAILLVLMFLLFKDSYGQFSPVDSIVEEFYEEIIVNADEIKRYANTSSLIKIISVDNYSDSCSLVTSRVSGSNYYLISIWRSDTVQLICHGFYGGYRICMGCFDKNELFSSARFRESLISAVFGKSDHVLCFSGDFELIGFKSCDTEVLFEYRFSDIGIEFKNGDSWESTTEVFYAVHASKSGVRPEFVEVK